MNSNISIFQLMLHAHPLVQVVLALLLIASVLSWTVIISKRALLSRTEKAAASLVKMESYAARIHGGLSPHNKKLKETEILIRHTAQRVDGMFHQASLEQQDVLHRTLIKLNALQAELMLSVFQH